MAMATITQEKIAKIIEDLVAARLRFEAHPDTPPATSYAQEKFVNGFNKGIDLAVNKLLTIKPGGGAR